MDEVLNYLQRHQARFVDELCHYVRFRSVSAQPEHRADMTACAEWLVAHCRSLGLDTQLCPTNGNPVVVAKTPRPKSVTRRKHFLVYGHYDVQPPEPFELWKTPPFQPTIQGRSLFGRAPATTRVKTSRTSKPSRPI